MLSLATGGAGELHLLEEHGLLWAQERFGLPWYCSGKECPWNKGDTGSFLGQYDPLEKGMATHSSTLAWRLLWTEEPGWPQSMGSHGVGHD